MVFTDSINIVKDVFKLIPRLVFTHLLRVFFNSKRDKSLSFFLSIVSFLIAVSSSYTTYLGVEQFMPAFFAFFFTIGIQGVLFVTSWRIGEGINQSKVPPFLLLSYSLTLIISVFFSYSGILNYEGIYPKENRKRDEFNRSIKKGIILTNDINKLVEQNNQIKFKNIVLTLSAWRSKFKSEIGKSKKYNALKDRYTNTLSTYDKKNDVYNRERLHGVIPSKRTGKLNGGYGKNAIELESNAQSFYFDKLMPLKAKINEIDSIEISFDNRYNFFTKQLANCNIENWNNLENDFLAYKTVISEYISLDSNSVELPKIVSRVSEIDPVAQFLTWQNTNIRFDSLSTIEEIRTVLVRFSSRIPKTEITSVNSYLEDIESIGKYGGENAHPFVIAINELGERNKITYLPLFLAFAMDLTVLFCGLLLAKPKSILQIKDAKELEKYSDEYLQNVFSLDLENLRFPNTPYVKTLAKILMLCKPDTQRASKGFPSYLRFSDIETNNLNKEIGILVSLYLAIKDESESVYRIRLKFIIWATEQINNSEQSELTLIDILEIITKTIYKNEK